MTVVTSRGLWVRWSWRDLRGRWVLVTAISLVIALGAGTYAALLSTSAWRRASNDASFALLNTHDVRVRLSQGSTVAEGRLAAVVASIPSAASVLGVRERLVVPTQVSAPHDLLVPGELVGTATGTDAGVDDVWPSAGRLPGPADDGQPVVVLDRQFASANRLPATGEVVMSGGARASYVGLGQQPEYFLSSGGQAALPFLSQRSFAVVYATLATAQALTGAAGQVNDVVLTLRPVDRRDPAQRPVSQELLADQVAAELRSALAGAKPAVSAVVSTRGELPSYRVLYDDIAGDAKLWRIVALLVLAGAAFAALNLTARIVEAQRREIGIGMALGVRPAVLAVRPMLFGTQVALFGVLLGVAVGWLVAIPLKAVLVEMLPLPVWVTPFQVDVYLQASALGFCLPLVAVAWPVWRAVRVQPVEAIRVGHLAARGGGLAPLLRRLPSRGRSYRQIPLRNVLRTPRRTLLTVLGIAAAITTLVTTIGFLDTFNATLDDAQHELLRSAPERLNVSLTAVEPADGDVVRAVRALPETDTVTAGLMLPVTAGRQDRTVDLLVEVLDDAALWTPTIESGTAHGGIVLASKAAADLHVTVGDTIEVTHPQASPEGLQTARTVMTVAGIHPNPMRAFAYLDPATATAFGMSGATNYLTVTPASGTSATQVQRALLSIPAVASAQAVRTTTEGMRTGLDEFIGILQIAALVTLLLALLIAVNTTSIGMDERARDHATMLAFGLPARTIIGLAIAETALVGAAATVVGIAGGYGVLVWMAATTIPAVLPEIGVVATLSTTTVLAAFALGVVTVAAAPLFNIRRLSRMDIPSTLRVME
ncbi:ABC transporter permease [Kineosporia sp. A_224]|uniref:ABC transporter permease n=1 Tax=Kineosporia sp. A_224 TaxID=1962180 RepID=UPI001179DD20|nr:ABC transporter permease [Kineosporia sp. A_224]